MATWQKQVKQIAMALSVIGGLWMALTVGLGDVFNIITDPASVDAATAASLGSEAWDLVTGNRTWANFDDIQNSYMLFLASSMVAGIVGLLDRR